MTDSGLHNAAETIGVAAVKQRFADVLGTVHHRGTRYIIERRGTPVAALVSLDDLALLQGDTPEGFSGFVGAFEDAGGLPDILDEVVRTRTRQVGRPAPSLEGDHP